jgi:mono/diheme cytochrome c family protein
MPIHAKTWLLSLWFLVVAVAQGNETFTFHLHGKPLKTLTRQDLDQLVPTKKLRVNELHTKESIEYVGYPFRALLEKVYGKELKAGEELLFTCLDGYQPSIALARALKHNALLATGRTDGKKFEFPNADKKGEITAYGPFYLVWDNVTDKALQKEGNETWPYQLSGVDLIRFSDKFPKLSPPTNSSAQAKAGFVVFRSQCLQCHKINGEGGDKGIELNYPMNVTEYWKEKALIQWMDNPRLIRYDATMPAVNPEYPNREQMFREIVAYLKAMAKHKIDPNVAK